MWAWYTALWPADTDVQIRVASKRVGGEIWASTTHETHFPGGMRLGERGTYLHDSGWAVLPLSAPLAVYHMLADPDTFAEILRPRGARFAKI